MRSRLASLALAALVIPAATALAQPSNNFCANAILLNANALRTGNNFGATSDLAGSGCSAADFNDIWFRYTAAAAGTHIFDTFGSSFDTTLAIYTACGGAQLACNDDEIPEDILTSLISIDLTAGQSIRIRLAGFLGDEGNYSLFLTAPAGPVTGACCATSGACDVQSEAACGTAGSAWQGAGTTCTPTPCPQPSGACCFGSTCSVAPSATCTGAGRRFAGASTVCNAAGNGTSPCCLADFNQDGSTTLQDLFDYLGAFFPALPESDINGGGVSVQDILDFLGHWFAHTCG